MSLASNCLFLLLNYHYRQECQLLKYWGMIWGFFAPHGRRIAPIIVKFIAYRWPKISYALPNFGLIGPNLWISDQKTQKSPIFWTYFLDICEIYNLCAPTGSPSLFFEFCVIQCINKGFVSKYRNKTISSKMSMNPSTKNVGRIPKSLGCRSGMDILFCTQSLVISAHTATEDEKQSSFRRFFSSRQVWLFNKV